MTAALQFDVNSPTSVSEIQRPARSKRRALFGLQFAGKIFLQGVVIKKCDSFLTMLEYASAVWPRKQRTPIVDVDAQVEVWLQAVVGMTLAPDKKTVDEWELKMDDMLMPFLRCPVKQIREFCSKLDAAIEKDARVPWMIKGSVRAYLKLIVGKASDTKIVELKKDIAGRIAKAVEGDVTPQLADAIAAALMWRDPETLDKIEGAVKKGHKAKMVGRESCLFLEIAGESVML